MRLALRMLVVPAATAVSAFVFFANEAPAHAQVYVVRREPSSVGLNLGFDAEGTANVTPPNTASDGGGGGFKLRVGAEIRRPFLRIIPEGGFAYDHLFISYPGGASEGWNMERLFVGGRIGFGEVVVPVIYGHVGYGWRAADSTAANPVPSNGGLTADAGVALDFHLIRHFGFGLHAEYVTVQAAPSVPDWIAFGAHCDFRF